MIGAINPNASTPIAKQQALARDSAYMLNPGEPFPAEAPPLPSSNPGAPAGTLVPGAGAPEEKKKGIGAGAIAGIVVAGISVIVLSALLFFFWGRSASLKDEVDRRQSTLRRISPSSSTAMLEAGRGAAGGTSSLAYSPAGHSPIAVPAPQNYPPAQHQQKYMATSPVGHPAYSPLTHSPSSSPTDTTPLHPQTQIQTQTQSQSPSPTPTALYPRNPPPHHRAHSPPPPLDPPDAKLGPYGRQVYGGTMNKDPAPALAHFEVVRGLGEGEARFVHVNLQQGPVEMEGTPAEATPVSAGARMPVPVPVPGRLGRPTWQEVKGERRIF